MQGHIQLLEQRMPVCDSWKGTASHSPCLPQNRGRTGADSRVHALVVPWGWCSQIFPLGQPLCAREELHPCLSPLQRPDSFPLTQSRALQLLYDLRYLSIILTAKSEDTKPSRIKQDSGYGTFWGSHPPAVLWGGPN